MYKKIKINFVGFSQENLSFFLNYLEIAYCHFQPLNFIFLMAFGWFQAVTKFTAVAIPKVIAVVATRVATASQHLLGD